MHESRGRVHQINVSAGGVPKYPVAAALVGPLGLEGDTHHDTKSHGGPDRAVCLCPLELIERLRDEGHPAFPGSMGENLTLEGLEWSQVVPGARLSVGEDVLIEVTSYTTPCYKIAGSFADGRFVRVSQNLYPGESRVYARVLRGGLIRTGDPVRLVLSVAPEPTSS